MISHTSPTIPIRNVECSPQAWTSSEPRLTGEVARRWNQDIHRAGEGTVEVGMEAAYLRNDGGYAGLSAILVLEDAGLDAEESVGLVFSGDFPPLPEPPTPE